MKNAAFIKRRHVQYAFKMSQPSATKIFKEFKSLLKSQGKDQIHKDYLPKEWFIKEFAELKAVPIDYVREMIEEALNDDAK